MPIRIYLLLFVCISFCSTQIKAQEVTLYRILSYVGPQKFVAKPGRYDSIPNPLTDNNIGSLKVPAGLKITLYENRNCMGESIEFYGDVVDLRKFTIAGKVSSFKVETNTRNISQQFIGLDNINEAFCPNAVLRGDREFDGNGPRMKCDVKIRIGDNGKSIYADIHFKAEETKHDWSTTEGTWSKKVYELLESNKKIVKIDMNEYAVTEFIGMQAGGEGYFGNSKPIESHQVFLDELTRKYPAINTTMWWKQIKWVIPGGLVGGYGNNNVFILPPLQGKLVKSFYLVGDTGGNDISEDATNCQDDTRVQKIEFNKVFVQIEQR